MAVILIAHSKVERVEDPLTPSYDRYSPRLHKHASALLGEWVDAILFAHWKYRTRSEDAGFGRERSIAIPSVPTARTASCAPSAVRPGSPRTVSGLRRRSRSSGKPSLKA